jgi:phosphoserine phosphatase RsbU/P
VEERTSAPPRLAVVVEDDPGIRGLLVEVLTDDGYTVAAYAAVAPALAALKQMTPTLIVTDLMFENGRTGWEVAHAARADPRLTQVPLIMCTAVMTTLATREAATQLCAVWVPKPFAIHTLFASIDRARSLARSAP